MSELIKAIAVTTELLGTEWSEGAARVVAESLSAYLLDDVKIALLRCAGEVKGRLTLADILDRLPGGHPGPEEAWSTVSRSMQSEAVTVVWTDQMREAYGVSCALGDDLVAARLAFKECYQKLVSEARGRNHGPVWSISKGTDRHDQERAITEALKQGKLLPDYARRQLPWSVDVDSTILELATSTAKRLA